MGEKNDVTASIAHEREYTRTRWNGERLRLRLGNQLTPESNDKSRVYWGNHELVI